MCITIEKQTKRSAEWSIQVKKRGLYGETLRPMLGRMEAYLSDYKCIFGSKTICVFDKAQVYCKGVFMSELSPCYSRAANEKTEITCELKDPHF